MASSLPRLIHGETKLIGLLGQNATYTLSPSMHNNAIQQFGLDLIYVNFDLPAAHVQHFLDVFWHLGGAGLNITKPHKGLVASLIPDCGLGSVNTLVRGTKTWEGHSTDGEGFARGLERLGLNLGAIETLVVLGAGGAAQAVIQHALSIPDTSLQKVVVLRRNGNHDGILSVLTRGRVELNCLQWAPEGLRQALQTSKHTRSLLVQAASVSNTHAPALQEFTDALIGFSGAFVDLIYDKPSALYFSALHHGIKAQDGLPMLIEQARLSQKLWWGRSASYDDMAAAIKNTGILG